MLKLTNRRYSTLVQSASPFEVDETASPCQVVEFIGDERFIGGKPHEVPEAKTLAGDGVSIRLT